MIRQPPIKAFPLRLKRAGLVLTLLALAHSGVVQASEHTQILASKPFGKSLEFRSSRVQTTADIAVVRPDPAPVHVAKVGLNSSVSPAVRDSIISAPLIERVRLLPNAQPVRQTPYRQEQQVKPQALEHISVPRETALGSHKDTVKETFTDSRDAHNFDSPIVYTAAVPTPKYALHISSRDRRISEALRTFAMTHGWHLSWEIDRDFPILFDASFSGSVLDIVEQMARALQNVDTPIRVKAYHANKVLRVLYATY